jgi:Phosphoinositide phospholipase C, Ca2+-dependent
MIRSTWALALVMLAAGSAAWAGDDVRINQIQVIGSHNSYHIAPHPNVQGLLGARGRVVAQGVDYTHPPLADQFSRQGLRQIELDVFADPDGGRYARPSARKLLKGFRKDAGPDPDADGQLRKPGFKVFHIQDIDYLSTVATFAEALRQVHAWSVSHPRHVPILVLVELKDDVIAALPTRPAPFGKAELDGIDAEIRSVFSHGEFFAPDDLRGPHATLPEAIKAKGWPTLDEARGKVLFALDNEGPLLDLYLADHEALKGRAMFATVPIDHPAAAWMKVNDPIHDFDQIQTLVKAGFLVRTRADADTTEARKNDPARREKALASGAQFVSTDFAEARPDLSTYRVKFPGGVVARTNPVNGNPALVGVDLEAATTGKE